MTRMACDANDFYIPRHRLATNSKNSDGIQLGNIDAE